MQNYNKMEVVGFEWPLNQNRFLIYEILYIYIYNTFTSVIKQWMVKSKIDIDKSCWC